MVYVQIRLRAGGYIEEVQYAVRNTGTRSILIMPVSIFWFSLSFRNLQCVCERHVISICREWIPKFLTSLYTYVRAGCCPRIRAAREGFLEELCIGGEGGDRISRKIQRCFRAFWFFIIVADCSIYIRVNRCILES